jgi:GDP-L-fucose synthase
MPPPRKLMDVGRLTSLGWVAKTSLREGIALAYADFLSSQ